MMDDVNVCVFLLSFSPLSFMIKPTQRICKYPLLLGQLAKALPKSHPSMASLQQAVEVMEGVLEDVNQELILSEGRLTLTRLQDELNWNPEALQVRLVTETRQHLLEDQMPACQWRPEKRGRSRLHKVT